MTTFSNGNDLSGMVQIPRELFLKLKKLGLLKTPERDHNVGTSDYSRHFIQPWSIWQDYNLNPWDADILKRVLRHKEGTQREEDYQKIIHICEERIRQLTYLNEEAQP